MKLTKYTTKKCEKTGVTIKVYEAAYAEGYAPAGEMAALADNKAIAIHQGHEWIDTASVPVQ